MKLIPRWLELTAAYLIFLLGAWKAWQGVKDDPILSLIFFITLGAIVGFWFVKVILPWMADAIGTSIFMSGEQITRESEVTTETDPDEQGREGAAEAKASPERKDETPS